MSLSLPPWLASSWSALSAWSINTWQSLTRCGSPISAAGAAPPTTSVESANTPPTQPLPLSTSNGLDHHGSTTPPLTSLLTEEDVPLATNGVESECAALAAAQQGFDRFTIMEHIVHPADRKNMWERTFCEALADQLATQSNNAVTMLINENHTARSTHVEYRMITLWLTLCTSIPPGDRTRVVVEAAQNVARACYDLIAQQTCQVEYPFLTEVCLAVHTPESMRASGNTENPDLTFGRDVVEEYSLRQLSIYCRFARITTTTARIKTSSARNLFAGKKRQSRR